MNTILFILSILCLFTFYCTNHVYKCEYTGISPNNIGTILGTIVGALINGLAWFWIFNLMAIID